MTPGDAVVIGWNDSFVRKGTIGTLVGFAPETGNALVLVNGRPVAFTWDQIGPVVAKRLGRPPVADISRPRCAEPGCEEPARTRGLCERHYQRWRTVRPDAPRCSVEGCESTALSRRLCRKHYERLMRWGDVNVVHPRGGVPIKLRRRLAAGEAVESVTID